MTDTEIKANLYALERRIYQIEQDMKRTIKVGNIVDIEQHLYGDVYENNVCLVKGVQDNTIGEECW